MNTPQVHLSTCCRKIADYDSHEGGPKEFYVCSKCHKRCTVEDETVCPHCLGKGEVRVMGRVYANEPHMADVDTEKCECQIKE